VIKVPFS